MDDLVHSLTLAATIFLNPLWNIFAELQPNSRKNAQKAQKQENGSNPEMSRASKTEHPFSCR